MLFTFPQGCCLPFLRDVTCLPFPSDSQGMSFTFPQGESQAGSPGLLAFQSAKSRSDFLSPEFWLSSPVQKKEQTSIDEILINLQLAKQWFPSSLIRWLCIQTVKYLLPLLKLPDRQLLLGLTWHRHAYHWNQTWWCQNTLSHCTHTWGKKK